MLTTVWHESFVVIKFYGLPLYHFRSKLACFNFTKPSFALDVMAVDYHAIYGF